MGHVPERTCLACGRKTNKAELLRIARNKEGSMCIDPRQKLPGRGAYVCRSLACAERLKKKRGLHHGFHQPVPNAVYESVIEFLRAHASN
jgi:predicted RNA-binding protein YlxR (DUF448 family)